jgi:hypothetical protein
MQQIYEKKNELFRRIDLLEKQMRGEDCVRDAFKPSV